MLEETKKVIEEIDELKKFAMDLMVKEDVFKDMDTEGVVAIHKCMKLVDMSCNLAEKQADMIDQMDRKLDLILEKLNKKEKA